MEKIMVLFNEGSGEDEGKKLAEQFQDQVHAKDPQIDVYLQATGPKIPSDPYVSKAAAESFDTLVVIGGDGTIHHVVKDFEKDLSKYTIGLIPGGTVNNMARVLSIPVEPVEAGEVILAGHSRGIDFGKINEDVIVSTMTIGILADTAARISQKEKQKYGKRIFIKRFLRLLAQKRHYNLRIKTDKEDWMGKTQLVTVTMTNSVGGYTNFDDSAAPDDGLFHITVLPRLRIWRLVFYLRKIIKGKIYDIPSIKYFTAKEMTITALKHKVGTRTDGDPTDDLPVTMQVVPKGLQVFVPKEK